MRYILLTLILLLGVQSMNAQESNVIKDVDSLYREDQIYFSVTYNILGNRPEKMSQNGFSGGFHFGFIRDVPINDKRNISLGIGLGLSSNSFNHNLQITKTDEEFAFNVLEASGEFNNNRFNLHQIELPIEFRWRTSTAETYNFWRIYTGFKFGYVLSSKTKFESSSLSNSVNLSDAINKLQYGLTLSVGYDSWNIHLYYALNDIFNNQIVGNESLSINVVKAGLIFYML